MNNLPKAMIRAMIKSIPQMSDEQILDALRKFWREEATEEAVEAALERIKAQMLP